MQRNAGQVKSSLQKKETYEDVISFLLFFQNDTRYDRSEHQHCNFLFRSRYNLSLKNVLPLNLPEGWLFLKVKITHNANSLLNLAKTKLHEVGLAPPCLIWFLLNRDPPGDGVMPRAEEHAAAQASHGNITALRYLKAKILIK